MFKATCITTAIAALSTSLSFAGGMGPTKAPCTAYEFKAGPYIGASIGPRIALSGVPLTYIGAQGTLSAGWGHIWKQRYYLAAEIYGANSAKLKNYGRFNQGVTSYTLQPTWDYGVDLMPGLMINDTTLGYARVGFEQTRMILNSALGSTGVNADGWRVGGGLQTNVYKNLDLRAEYIFTDYGTLTHYANAGNQFAMLGNLGLVYKFV